VKIGASLLALIFTMCSCSTLAPADVYFPTYGPMEGFPTADLEASLVRADSCLFLESAGTQYLALWPSTLSPRSTPTGSVVIVDGDDRPMVTEGETAVFGGGEYPDSQLSLVENLVGDVPTECEKSRYWLVSRVLEPGTNSQ
jgi:hypothetical protein